MDRAWIQIVDYLWSQSIQVGLLIVAVALISRALSRQSSHLRYLLWLIVVAKCLVPPFFHIGVPVLPGETPRLSARQLERSGVAANPALSEKPTPAGGLQATELPREAQFPMRLAPALWRRQTLAIAWLAGLAVFLTAVSIKAGCMTRRLMKKRTELSAQAVFREFEPHEINHAPRVWLVDDASQPFVWGLWGGDIYLPVTFRQLNPEHQRDVLAHELSHVLRFDAAVNLLQVVAQAVFWFHPLVWWANARMRREREKCCDEIAIARLGAQPKSYSRAIVATLLTEHGSKTVVPSLAIAGPTRNIEERIETMLRPGKKFYRKPSFVGVSCALTLAVLVVPTHLVLTARAARAAGGTAVAKTNPVDQRMLSAARMRQLVLSLTLYALDHEKKYPGTIGELTPYYGEGQSEELLTFATSDVEYLAAGKTSPDTHASSIPLAFDVTLLRTAGGTNIAFADGHIAFTTADGLKAYGITLPENHLEIVDVRFEPIHQGKNVVYITTRNASDSEQVLGGHIYTRSPDYGPSGMGWGTSGYFETLRARETKSVRWAFKIQGPVTPKTYVSLRLSNPATRESYDDKWCFQDRKYTSEELPKAEAGPAAAQPASTAEAQAVTQAFTEVQRSVQDGQYAQAWARFTRDCQKAEFQRDGLARFRQTMEPTHPTQPAFTWTRGDFLKLKPGQVSKAGNTLSLAATMDNQTWTIDFVFEDNQWKIDWIAGYVPAVAQPK
jgi:prepilin-type processing-associated H-X9-DG protein